MELNKIKKIQFNAGKSVSPLTQAQLDALAGAGIPGAGNKFTTVDFVTGLIESVSSPLTQAQLDALSGEGVPSISNKFTTKTYVDGIFAGIPAGQWEDPLNVQGARLRSSTSIPSGQFAVAEGIACLASFTYAHAEGNASTASGDSSHSEGKNTIASGEASHAEGFFFKSTRSAFTCRRA